MLHLAQKHPSHTGDVICYNTKFHLIRTKNNNFMSTLNFLWGKIEIFFDVNHRKELPMYIDDTKNKRRCTRDFCQIAEWVYRAHILGRNGVSFIGKMKFN